MFTLDHVVPWGRSFDEYRRMFALTERDFSGRILGCADGPAAFNAAATRRGYRVVSCDPLYRFDTTQIRRRIDATFEQVMEQTRRNMHEFVWKDIGTVEELGRLRSEAMQTFVDDYDVGKSEGRYVDAELPSLPFDAHAFDLAVCSHFLFLYSDQLDEAFHLDGIIELARVAPEVRIFPLLALGARPSSHVERVASTLRQRGMTVTIERVDYEFQRGGDQMMRVRASS